MHLAPVYRIQSHNRMWFSTTPDRHGLYEYSVANRIQSRAPRARTTLTTITLKNVLSFADQACQWSFWCSMNPHRNMSKKDLRRGASATSGASAWVQYQCENKVRGYQCEDKSVPGLKVLVCKMCLDFTNLLRVRVRVRVRVSGKGKWKVGRRMSGWRVSP
jgi:hypothetical protein